MKFSDWEKEVVFCPVYLYFFRISNLFSDLDGRIYSGTISENYLE